MSPDQARALLELLADLYRVAAQPEPMPAPEPTINGTADRMKAKT